MYVSDIGLKLNLKKIKFGEQRDDNLDYHMHVEGKMLKMYANLLLEMLTNRQGENLLDTLEIDDIELKSILYECLNAEMKTLKRDQERYSEETKRYIEKHLAGQSTNSDLAMRNKFKEMVEQQKSQEASEEANMRRIQRKPQMPQANFKNYDRENERMGVKSAVDLFLGEQTGKDHEHEVHKFDADLIRFTHDSEDKINKAKEPKYLTIKGLLDHPYFIEINEADISKVIEEFEKLENIRLV